MRIQFELDVLEAKDADMFVQEHATRMPHDLPEPQLLYMMALCVAEVAGTVPPHCTCATSYGLCSLAPILYRPTARQLCVVHATTAPMQHSPCSGQGYRPAGPLSPRSCQCPSDGPACLPATRSPVLGSRAALTEAPVLQTGSW